MLCLRLTDKNLKLKYMTIKEIHFQQEAPKLIKQVLSPQGYLIFIDLL